MAVNGVNGVNGELSDSVELWRHPDPESTQLHAFQQHVAKKHGFSAPSYHDLWQWSIDCPSAFWEEVWLYTGIKANRKYDAVCRHLSMHHRCCVLTRLI